MLDLFKFKPHPPAVARALALWFAASILVVILAFAIWVLGARLFPPRPWVSSLTEPASISVGASTPYIRLRGSEAECTLAADSRNMQCQVLFEGESLQMDVELEASHWDCQASYAGNAVPCRASFDNATRRTYLIVEDNLGLGTDRYQQLVQATKNVGWSEADYQRLASVIAIVLGLAVAATLWRHTGRVIRGNQSDLKSPGVLRGIYTIGASAILWGAVRVIAYPVLFALRLID